MDDAEDVARAEDARAQRQWTFLSTELLAYLLAAMSTPRKTRSQGQVCGGTGGCCVREGACDLCQAHVQAAPAPAA